MQLWQSNRANQYRHGPLAQMLSMKTKLMKWCQVRKETRLTSAMKKAKRRLFNSTLTTIKMGRLKRIIKQWICRSVFICLILAGFLRKHQMEAHTHMVTSWVFSKPPQENSLIHNSWEHSSIICGTIIFGLSLNTSFSHNFVIWSQQCYTSHFYSSTMVSKLVLTKDHQLVFNLDKGLPSILNLFAEWS